MRSQAANQGVAVLAAVSIVTLLLILTTNSVQTVTNALFGLFSTLSGVYSGAHCFGTVPGC